ncbi:MAG: hypothetical protein JJE04_20740 [Acidobacteriia bacterium]|nr:hypothetical protein [Terriglobia bacterium]
MSTVSVLKHWPAAKRATPILLFGFVLFPGSLPAQTSNLLQRAFGTSSSSGQPLLSTLAPGFSLTVASREFDVERTSQPNAARLTLPGIPLRFDLRYQRQAGIDLYRLQPAPDSELRAEHVRFDWRFPDAYNESMTFDTGALQGQPLYLPNGKVPDNQFTNWGSLFYNREANLAVGAVLDGAEPSRRARRGHSRFTKSSTLQLMTTTGNPKMEITLFAYRPKDQRFWWAEWYQLRSASDPGIPANFFPILAPDDLSWQPGEQQMLTVIPGPGDRGRRMELILIDELRRKVVSRVPFQYDLPVTNVAVKVESWPSSLYRLIVVPTGEAVDPMVNDLNRKLNNVIIRARVTEGAARARVLFVAPTDAWLAYATNGGHDYHGWRTGYDGSVGYAPTVMSSRQRRLNNFFYSLYERYNDIHHFRYLYELSRQDGFEIEFASQHDVARGRVRLEDYRLVLIGNHCEFTTEESYRRFAEYMGNGGGVLIHGGDSFAVMVNFLPTLEQPRYIWQRGHFWTHWSDQPSDFRGPQLLPPNARADAPITNPTPGDAIDYLNLFHTSVGYWIPGSKAVIANTVHPIVRGLNLKLGDEVPGPWGGEVDFAYEPQAWDILVRSGRAAPEEREFGIDAYDPTPLHRIGIAVHKNDRLAMICGENFPNILVDPRYTLFRELYRRTLHHMIDSAKAVSGGTNLVPPQQRDSTLIRWDLPVRIGALRYELPGFIDFQDPDWHRKPAPYAHYVIEGSADGEHWIMLADRRHGPWRGTKTDVLAPGAVRHLRFVGTFSNGQPFRVRNVQALPVH